MTFTSPTLRQVSRIYQDLRSRHFQSISGVTPVSLEKSHGNMGSNANVSRKSVLEAS